MTISLEVPRAVDVEVLQVYDYGRGAYAAAWTRIQHKQALCSEANCDYCRRMLSGG